MANRVVESARSILTNYIPDVYLYTDVYKGAESGACPGYALSLVAETTTGALISSECIYQPRQKAVLDGGDDDGPVGSGQRNDDGVNGYDAPDGVVNMLVNDYTFPTPEDLGVRAARQLLVEIKKGKMSMDGWIEVEFLNSHYTLLCIGGSVDGISQWLNILYMALGPEDVGKIRIGSLTPFTYVLTIVSALANTICTNNLE